jgi:hypothetical protein
MAEKVFYGIVTQFDCPAEKVEKFGFHQSGPIIYECMLKDWAMDEAKVRERAKAFVGLGWVRIAKIIVDIPEGES